MSIFLGTWIVRCRESCRDHLQPTFAFQWNTFKLRRSDNQTQSESWTVGRFGTETGKADAKAMGRLTSTTDALGLLILVPMFPWLKSMLMPMNSIVSEDYWFLGYSSDKTVLPSHKMFKKWQKISWIPLSMLIADALRLLMAKNPLAYFPNSEHWLPQT